MERFLLQETEDREMGRRVGMLEMVLVNYSDPIRYFAVCFQAGLDVFLVWWSQC